eukprot:TRINITY_DN2969_c0_g2_i2.p1 TRINITY_DN2969_c0_g2~~TRINITY_DN2969_c0_g2_i2.p1  ORF type:complete len:105 (-),score=12.51 TRINITY_DN2969_c0_g2_i2:55-369(-)
MELKHQSLQIRKPNADFLEQFPPNDSSVLDEPTKLLQTQELLLKRKGNVVCSIIPPSAVMRTINQLGELLLQRFSMRSSCFRVYSNPEVANFEFTLESTLIFSW